MNESPPMLNLDDLGTHSFGRGEQFGASIGRVAGTLGMQKIGCSRVELEPGKRGWPMHGHYAREECFIVLAGEGSIRYADGTYPIRTGDVIFTPPGQARAHQIVNTSEAKLRYLALSSQDSPEICYYPDSRKISAFKTEVDGSFSGFMVKDSAGIGYWDGED